MKSGPRRVFRYSSRYEKALPYGSFTNSIAFGFGCPRRARCLGFDRRSPDANVAEAGGADGPRLYGRPLLRFRHTLP
jgi:hypothetical protein